MALLGFKGSELPCGLTLADTWIDPLTSPIQLVNICGARALLYQLLHQTVSLRVRVDLFRETLAQKA